MTPRRRAHLRRVGAATITLLAALWVADQVDGAALVIALADAQAGWLLLAVALVPLQTLLAGERWFQVCRALGTPLPRRVAWSELAVSTAVNQLLPGGVAGDALRVWRQRQVGLGTAARAAVVDRAWGQTTLACVVLVSAFSWPKSAARPAGLQEALVLSTAVVAGVWLLPRQTPLLGAVSDGLRRCVRSGPGRPLLLSIALLATILAGFAACGLAVSQPPGPWLWTAAPVALLAMSLPVSAGGWGLREGSLVALLPLLGWTAPNALAVSLLFGLTFLVGALPGLALLSRARSTEAP